jgi:hypothetical protein
MRKGGDVGEKKNDGAAFIDNLPNLWERIVVKIENKK